MDSTRRLGLLLPLYAACASTPDVGSQLQACQALATAQCERWYDCSGPAHFRSLDECRQQEAEICLSLYGLPGIDPSPAGTRRLSASIPGMRCMDVVPFRYSVAPGSLREGELCTRDEQCGSGDCEYPLPYGCPVCYVEPPLSAALDHACGAADPSYRCPRGTQCQGTTGAERCALEVPCTGSDCPAELGDACGPGLPVCEPSSKCSTEAQRCQLSPLPSRLGEACGGSPGRFLGGCGSWEYCDTGEFEDAPGVCKAQHRLGEACRSGRECGESLRCESGTCQVATLLPPDAACSP